MLGFWALQILLALDELYAVAVRVFDEEEAGAAAHGVRLALELHATGLALQTQTNGVGYPLRPGEGFGGVAAKNTIVV